MHKVTFSVFFSLRTVNKKQSWWKLQTTDPDSIADNRIQGVWKIGRMIKMAYKRLFCLLHPCHTRTKKVYLEDNPLKLWLLWKRTKTGFDPKWKIRHLMKTSFRILEDHLRIWPNPWPFLYLQPSQIEWPHRVEKYPPKIHAWCSNKWNISWTKDQFWSYFWLLWSTDWYPWYLPPFSLS